MRDYILCLGIIAFILIVTYVYINNLEPYKISDEFQFEGTYLESLPNGVFLRKRANDMSTVILDGDFMDIVRVGIEIEDLENSENTDNVTILQVGFKNNGILKYDKTNVLYDLSVSAKYCESNRICLIVQNKTNFLSKRIVSLRGRKAYFRGILSFEYSSGNKLNVFFQSTKLICTPLASVPVLDLKLYTMIAQLADAFFAKSVMTFYDDIKVFNQVHKEIFVSPDGKAIANYDIEYQFRNSFADLAIHKSTGFGRSILQYEGVVTFQKNSTFIDKQEKNLFEVGLAPYHLLSKKTALRNEKETFFIQVSFQYNILTDSRFHFYVWKNGTRKGHFILSTAYIAENQFKFFFQFIIDLDSNRIKINYKLNNPTSFGDFKNVEFESILCPTVGKETSLYPITISYKIWRPEPFHFDAN